MSANDIEGAHVNEIAAGRPEPFEVIGKVGIGKSVSSVSQHLKDRPPDPEEAVSIDLCLVVAVELGEDAVTAVHLLRFSPLPLGVAEADTVPSQPSRRALSQRSATRGRTAPAAKCRCGQTAALAKFEYSGKI